jgi:hypothetical protein
MKTIIKFITFLASLLVGWWIFWFLVGVGILWIAAHNPLR